ncbi:hypothetical protein ACFVYG_32510 [Streptomyces sp. NPDC058256]|uniref:hypothetical protein n=1 Tax=Streptomyces sp. NPDC058256 TaxID=3346408 RepID=UPI0036EB3AD0
MANEPENTPNQSEYAQRLADALAANRKEQDDITAHSARLQERLDQLRQDEAWLANSVQAARPATDAPAGTEPAAGEAEASSASEDERSESDGSTQAPAETAAEASRAVPKPRQDEERSTESRPAAKAPGKKAPAKKAAPKKTAAKKTTKKTTTAKEPAAAKEEAAEKETSVAKAAAKKPDEPPLHQLILAILLKTPGEPQQARDVLDKLTEAHPERARSIQVVRNNLEILAKKGTIDKSHQKNSAMYTANAADADAPDASDADQASQKASEKVPAEV